MIIIKFLLDNLIPSCIQLVSKLPWGLLFASLYLYLSLSDGDTHWNFKNPRVYTAIFLSCF